MGWPSKHEDEYGNWSDNQEEQASGRSRIWTYAHAGGGDGKDAEKFTYKSVLKHRDIKVNDVIEGKVRRIESNRVFVDIGLEKAGLLPISRVSYRRLDSLEGMFAIGDVIKVKVFKIESQENRIILSRKELLDVYREHQQQVRKRRNYSNWH